MNHLDRFKSLFKKKTIIEILAQHLVLMTHAEKIEHLKAIIPQVCPGVSVHKNPPKGRKNHATNSGPVVLTLDNASG